MDLLKDRIDTLLAITGKLTANPVANLCYDNTAMGSADSTGDADGVASYDVTAHQNIPLALASILQVNDTVLAKGFRSKASSITRMLLNHFLGRTSFNLNKIIAQLNSFFTYLLGTIKNPELTFGFASLDADGRVPYSQLPESAMEYEGNWNADTNTPTLANGTGVNGEFYIVSVGGTQNLGDSYTEVTPEGTENPQSEGWYVYDGNDYVPTTDVTVDPDTTYYEKHAGTSIIFLPNDRIIFDGNTRQWQKLTGGSVRSVNNNTPDLVTGNVDVPYVTCSEQTKCMYCDSSNSLAIGTNGLSGQLSGETVTLTSKAVTLLTMLSVTKNDKNDGSSQISLVKAGEDNFINGATSPITANDYAVSIGKSNCACSNSVLIGRANKATCDDAILLGDNNTVCDFNGIAIGFNTGVEGSNSVALGCSACVDSTEGIAIGASAGVCDDYGIALGTSAKACCASVSIGYRASACNEMSIGIGHSATVSSVNSCCAIAIGASTSVCACSESAVALGNAVEVTGISSIGIGSAICTNGCGTIAIGLRTCSSGFGSIAIGCCNYADSKSIAIGNNSTVTGISIGTCNTVTLGSIVLGCAITTSGGGVVLGNTVTATGNNAIAIGTNLTANTNNSIVIGCSAKASSIAQVVLGTSNYLELHLYANCTSCTCGSVIFNALKTALCQLCSEYATSTCNFRFYGNLHIKGDRKLLANYLDWQPNNGSLHAFGTLDISSASCDATISCTSCYNMPQLIGTIFVPRNPTIAYCNYVCS